MSEPLYHIVDGLHDARSLVYATWLRSYQAASPQTKHIPREIYFGEHHQVLDRIFARAPTIKLATMPDDARPPGAPIALHVMAAVPSS